MERDLTNDEFEALNRRRAQQGKEPLSWRDAQRQARRKPNHNRGGKKAKAAPSSQPVTFLPRAEASSAEVSSERTPEQAESISFLVPDFDQRASGQASDWNTSTHVQSRYAWNKRHKEREQLDPTKDVMEEAKIFIRTFLRTRKGPSNSDLTAKLGDPVMQEDWVRFPLRDVVQRRAGTDDRVGYHGTKLESLYSILYLGKLQPSQDSSQGEQYFEGYPGVYIHSGRHERKAESYVTHVWFPILKEGNKSLRAVAAKLAVSFDQAAGSLRGSKATDQYILREDYVQLEALLLHITDSLPLGTYVQTGWNPLAEAAPIQRIARERPEEPSSYRNPPRSSSQPAKESATFQDDDNSTWQAAALPGRGNKAMASDQSALPTSLHQPEDDSDESWGIWSPAADSAGTDPQDPFHQEVPQHQEGGRREHAWQPATQHSPSLADLDVNLDRLSGRGAHETRRVMIGKLLTQALRHDPVKYGISLDTAGYANLKSLLNSRQFWRAEVTVHEVQRVLETSQKVRMEQMISEEDGEIYIRALQGHGRDIPLDDDQLHEVLTSSTTPEWGVHGTSWRAWQQIRSSQLRRMQRRDIHMSLSPTKTAGFREDSSVEIWIHLPSLIDSGHKVRRAKNGVLLTRGPIDLSHISTVKDRHTGKSLPF